MSAVWWRCPLEKMTIEAMFRPPDFYNLAPGHGPGQQQQPLHEPSKVNSALNSLKYTVDIFSFRYYLSRVKQKLISIFVTLP